MDMMHVRHMRVAVRQLVMAMEVSVRLPRRVGRPVRMLVMLIVHM